jgi:hypothetical protein
MEVGSIPTKFLHNWELRSIEGAMHINWFINQLQKVCLLYK